MSGVKGKSGVYDHHKIKGDKNYNWKGEDAKYTTKHYVIGLTYGKATECECCGNTKGAKRCEWANISGEYKRDRSDWVQLCKICHSHWDLGKIEFMGIRKQPKKKCKK